MSNWNELLDIRRGKFIIDFRICNPISHTKGDTYFDSERAWINLMPHENLWDIYDTINHEALHIALHREEINDDSEHLLFKYIAWVQNEWI